LNESGTTYKVKRTAVDAGQLPATYVVDSVLRTCTCGKWQEQDLPCIDAVAYFRHAKERDQEWIFTREVSKFYSVRNHNEMFRKNICPVTTDFITTDGITLPPSGTGRGQVGARKKKRLRPQRNYIDVPTAKYKCKVCQKLGHNTRTCPVVNGNGQSNESEESDEEEPQPMDDADDDLINPTLEE
jgi:hypothetical protein